MKKYQWILLGLGMFWIMITATSFGTVGEEVGSLPRKGFLAPDFSLDDLGGKNIQLSLLEGKVVVINFWASWCIPCKTEMPALEKISRRYQDQEVIILAVNATSQDNLPDVSQFVMDNGLTLPILLDSDGSVTQIYQVRAFPTTFFIDQEGKISSIVVGGPISEGLVASEIEQLLESGAN